MGFLDTAFGVAGGGQPHWFDSKTRLLQTALALLADTGQTGGLPGLAERFERAGLGHLLASWIGSGPNRPISGQQVEQVLGDGHLQQISEETGLSEEETANHLSEMLPELVDRLTPDGHVPPSGLGDLSMLLARFMNTDS